MHMPLRPCVYPIKPVAPTRGVQAAWQWLEVRYKLLRRGMILQAGCNGNDVIAIWHEHQISDMKGTFLPKIWEK